MENGRRKQSDSILFFYPASQYFFCFIQRRPSYHLLLSIIIGIREEWRLLKTSRGKIDVMPAKAGIQKRPKRSTFFNPWIRAFTGMTT